MFLTLRPSFALAAMSFAALAACGATDTPPESTPSATEAAAPADAARVEAAAAPADAVASGRFEGRSDHVTTGGVSLVKEGDRYVLVLAEDFSLDGAPDPKVGFGRGGSYDTASTVAPLASNTGAQRYDLPASFDPAAYDEAYIWCEQFSVPLGVAPLN